MLNKELKENILSRRLPNNTDFDYENLLLNPKKIKIYLQNAGKTLDMFKLDYEFNYIKNDLVHEYLNIIEGMGSFNILHRNISPKHLCYQVVENGEDKQIDNVKSTYMTSQHSSNRDFEGAYDKEELSLFEDDDLIEKDGHFLFDKKSIKNDLFEVKKEIFEFDLSSFMSMKNTHSIYGKRMKNQNSSEIKLTLINLSKCEVKNNSIFNYEINKSVKKCIQQIRSKRVDINLNIFDNDFDFYKSLKDLKKQSNQNLKQNKMIKKQAFKKIIMDDDNYEDDLQSYRTRIHSLNSSNPENLGFNQSMSIRSQVFGSVKIRKDSANSIGRKLYNFFFHKEPEKKIEFLSKNQKQEIREVVNKIQEHSIPKKNKYKDLLSYLRVESYFLSDIEAAFYTLLESIDLFPRARNQSFKSASKISKTHDTASSKRKRSCDLLMINQKLSILLNDQIDVLIFILLMKNEQNFFLLKSQLLWYFKYLDSDPIVKQIDSFEKKMEGNQEQACLIKFKILKIIIFDISKYNKKQLFEVFKIINKTRVHFLNKLALEFSDASRDHVVRIREFYKLYKNYFFHFLIDWMYGDSCHYFHKACVLAILQQSSS